MGPVTRSNEASLSAASQIHHRPPLQTKFPLHRIERDPLRSAIPAMILCLVVACSQQASVSPPPTANSPLPTPVASSSPTARLICPDATSGGGFLCDREAKAVEEAVRTFYAPIIRITLHHGWICLDDPFRATPCIPPTPAGARQLFDSAVVEFGGTPQRAYVNLYDRADYTLATEVRFLTPPASASP